MTWRVVTISMAALYCKLCLPEPCLYVTSICLLTSLITSRKLYVMPFIFSLLQLEVCLHSPGVSRFCFLTKTYWNILNSSYINYVVQFIIELKIPSVAAMLCSQFERRYVYLSRQKFSSHVIEKLLKCFEKNRSKIINELVSEPHFDQLLEDSYVSCVIQSALGDTKVSI